MELGVYYVACRFKYGDGNFIWVFIGVYEPVSSANREELWVELGDIRELWGDPWCISGDFNVVRFPKEGRNSSRLSSAMRRFWEVIEELLLRDLPLDGGCFTWCGGLNNRYSSRLDRFLVLEEWVSHFNGLSQKLLPRPTIDHVPILLKGAGIRSGKSPSCFENMWLRVEGLKDLVRRRWTDYTLSGLFSHILACKLKALKQDLKTWNIEVIGYVSSNKEFALSQIGYWDAK